MTTPIQLNVNSSTEARPITASGVSSSRSSGVNFADSLAQAQNIRFSNHAQKRLETRNISLNDDGLNRLSNAVDKAEKRGGKESLVLVDNMAFIVNVKERLVVTAMDSQSRGEGVFTKIDSVVFADPSSETAGQQAQTIDQSA
jgi:flagellar operon protein